jgi:hypothetical protein
MPKAAKLNRHFVMDRWFDILEGEPPRMVEAPILHHYTDAFGVQGIVSSNSLWATATQFSNDLSEIEYSVSVAVELIQETWGDKKRIGPWEKVLAEHLVRLFHTPLHSFGQPFIVSFCEDGDLLSQWRAYGGMSGFSLAFSPLVEHDKVKLACRNGFRTMIKRVIYNPDEQRARLRFLFNHLIKLVNGFSFATTSSQGAAAHVELSYDGLGVRREAQGFFRGKGMADYYLPQGCDFGWGETRELRRGFSSPYVEAFASIYDFGAPVSETVASD